MSDIPPQKPDRQAFVTASDVARRAGVSRSAVSRTFSGSGVVSDVTRSRVLKAAEELGYHTNQLARGLTGEPSNIVGLIAADIDQPFQSRLLDQVTRKLQAQGKVALVINTSGDEDSVSAALRQSLHYRAEASVVLTGTPPARLIETCMTNGQRVILVNRADPAKGADLIRVDNESACREAVKLLARAGCRRLAVVSATARTSSLVAREDAFSAAAQAEGLPFDIVRAGPTSYESGAEAARLVLGRSEPPDGVFCVTDLLALAFVDMARQVFRRRIPEDLCVIGFDDIPQARWKAYDLTTFQQPIAEIAEQIAAVIAADRNEPVDIVVSVTPVWRGTLRMG